jgi:eukaryotic-like serine/threonine-protein kinase
LFRERSVRIWTVLGSMASVGALIWAIHPIHDGFGAVHGTTSPSSTGSSATHVAARHSTAIPPGGSTQPSDVWIAQLASVRVGAGSAQLHRTLDQIRTEIPGAQYLDSSNYASLNPGYWVVYYDGRFSDGNQALSYCANHGRATRNQCVGRFLSNDVRDKSYTCFPPAGSQTTGCYHSSTTALRIISRATEPVKAV